MNFGLMKKTNSNNIMFVYTIQMHICDIDIDIDDNLKQLEIS